jgi:hypothetical protein
MSRRLSELLMLSGFFRTLRKNELTRLAQPKFHRIRGRTLDTANRTGRATSKFPGCSECLVIL